MQHPIRMTECRPLQQLIHETSNRIRMQCSSFTTGVHISLQILITEFKHKDKLCLGMNDVMKTEDIDVFEFL